MSRRSCAGPGYRESQFPATQVSPQMIRPQLVRTRVTTKERRFWRPRTTRFKRVGNIGGSNAEPHSVASLPRGQLAHDIGDLYAPGASVANVSYIVNGRARTAGQLPYFSVIRKFEPRRGLSAGLNYHPLSGRQYRSGGRLIQLLVQIQRGRPPLSTGTAERLIRIQTQN